MKYALLCSLLFIAHNSFAQSTVPVAADVTTNGTYAPVVRAGVRDAQISLSNQTPVDPKVADPAGLGQMHGDAIRKSGPDEISRKQQFNLAAEILPFLAPWLNEISKDCVSKIPVNDETEKATAAFNECSRKAVAEFQRNPSAFFDKLSQDDKNKLQALIDRRVSESAEVRKPTSSSP